MSQYFLISEIAVSTRSGHLKVWALEVVVFSDFCSGGSVIYLLEFNCFILPDLVRCFLRYPVSTFNFTL